MPSSSPGQPTQGAPGDDQMPFASVAKSGFSRCMECSGLDTGKLFAARGSIHLLPPTLDAPSARLRHAGQRSRQCGGIGYRTTMAMNTPYSFCLQSRDLPRLAGSTHGSASADGSLASQRPLEHVIDTNRQTKHAVLSPRRCQRHLTA